jgi:hypothetical protein
VAIAAEVEVDLVQFAPFFLFLHVMGAILAFGPTYAYSIMGSMAGRSRSTRTSARARSRPSATSSSTRSPSSRDRASCLDRPADQPQNQPWLVASIILYLIAITYALTVQRNALHHLIEMSSTPPPPGTPPGPPPPELLHRQEDPAWRDLARGAGRHHRLPHGGQARPLIIVIAGPRDAVP